MLQITAEEFELISEDDDTLVIEGEKHYRHNGSLYEYVFMRDGKYYMISEYIFEDNGIGDWSWPVDAVEVEPREKVKIEWVRVKH